MADPASVVISFGATVVPFFIGASLVALPPVRKHPQGSLAVAIGMTLFLLVDAFLDSTELGVTRGLQGGLQSLVLVVAFSVPFLILVLSRNGQDRAWPLWAVAVGISIHSFSEADQLTSAAPLYLSSFGTVALDAASFVLHKAIEGFVLAAAAALTGTSLRRTLRAGLPMVLLAAAGSLSASLPLNLSPFLAAGAGGWLAVTLSLAPQFRGTNRSLLYFMVLAGFIIVYSASLLHFA